MRPLVTILSLLGFTTMLLVNGCVAHSRSTANAAWREIRTDLSKEELAEILAQYEDTYEATVREAADRILTKQTDRRTRRLTLLWQTRLIPMMRDALDQEDAVHAMLDAWALCLRAGHFFETGDARDMFGENQHLAIDAARRSLDSIENIASRILAPEALNRTREAVDDLARRFPLRGEFSGSIVRTAVQKTEKDPDIVASILAAPIAPFRAFEGIDRGAAAIRGFTAVAARMTDTVHDFPENLRLQAQLLVMELEDLESTQAALSGLAEISRSSARISTVAEELPANLRRELALAADDLEARQAQLQQTLRDAQDVAARVNEALRCVESAAAAVESTATQTTAAGESWTQTFRAISEMIDSFRQPEDGTSRRQTRRETTVVETRPAPAAIPTPPDSERRGFDVNEYTQAAQALDMAAARLQELTREIRELAGSNELESSLRNLEIRAQQVVEASQTSAINVVDHLTWRGVQIVLLFFAALIVYTLLGRVFPRRPDAAGSPGK